MIKFTKTLGAEHSVSKRVEIPRAEARDEEEVWVILDRYFPREDFSEYYRGPGRSFQHAGIIKKRTKWIVWADAALDI